MDFLKRKKKTTGETLPTVLQTQPKNPVNYNSVLDYLVGLSETDYDRICTVSKIYRTANADAAKVLGVEDKPITALKTDQDSDEEIDDALDTALRTKTLLVPDSEPAAGEIVKPHSPSTDTKINVEQAS